MQQVIILNPNTALTALQRNMTIGVEKANLTIHLMEYTNTNIMVMDSLYIP